MPLPSFKWFSSPCLALVMAWALPAAGIAAAPELSSASVMASNEEPWLLYGQGLDDPRLTIQVTTAVPTPGWDPVVSLRRVLKGEVSLPARPTKDAVRLNLYARDANTAAIHPFSNRWRPPGRLVWATGEGGTSRPLVLNRPEIWVITPPRLMPNGRVRIFGPNMGSDICLVGPDGKICRCRWFLSYSQEKGIAPAFERTLEVPADLLPGKYRLFVNNGGGDYGWSLPFPVELIAPPPTPSNLIRPEVPADGSSPCAAAIQKVIDKLAASGGGIVVLGPGIFRLEAGLRVKPGVILRGAGSGATILASPRVGQLEPLWRDYRVLVKMADRSSLETLTIDASDGRDHRGVLIQRTSDVTIRDCRILNLALTERPEGKWVPTDRTLVAVGDIHRLVLVNNELRGEEPFCHWGGTMTEAYIAHNRFEGLPIHNSNVSIRGLRRSVFEHNRVLNSGRGIVVAGEAVHNFFGYNIVQNIRGIGNGCEMFLYEMGQVKWQGTPGEVGPDWFVMPGQAWNAETLRDTAGSFIYTACALITGGRGMGQCLPIASAVGNRVTLGRPWTAPPDQTSNIAVVYGCLENLHVENQFKEGVAYSGPFGSAVRNIWAGEEFESVSDGMMLWAIRGGHQVSLNLVRDLRCQDRAGIELIAECLGDDGAPVKQVKVFGNEIRTCQVYRRERYPGNEYGLGNKVWRYPFNNLPPGNARHVTFGDEAGIHLSQLRAWPGSVSDDDPEFDKLARWCAGT